MSWADKLIRLYDENNTQEARDRFAATHPNAQVLLPVSHSTANAQVELTIKKDGTVSARALSKEEGQNTIVPVTEDSGARGSDIAPMPLADKWEYIAKDYETYVDGKKNGKKHAAYMSQLDGWVNSEFAHPAVVAIHEYLSKGTVMRDMVESGFLTLDENGKVNPNVKIAGIVQPDCFVRFVVEGDETPETWLDATLYDSFAKYYASCRGDAQLCYLTGEMVSCTYKHPYKLRNAGDKAKIFSANDESGFSYRGRFKDKTEAVSIGYESSQKLHNALRWLISTQRSESLDSEVKRESMLFDSLQLVVWTSGNVKSPSFLGGVNVDIDVQACDGDVNVAFADSLKRDIFCAKSLDDAVTVDENAEFMIMGIDSATPGRMSVGLYEEMRFSRVIDSLVRWHYETAVRRYYYKRGEAAYSSFSVRDIIKCAYGTEGSSGFLDATPGVIKDTVMRLLPCIMQGRRIPADIVRALVRKASNPVAYKNAYNFQKVLEVACGMIRRKNIEDNKGVMDMAYDASSTDRSYLFGCLLAIADVAENSAYGEGDKGKRVTNAKRYWNMFAKQPYRTWLFIEKHLQPYLRKLGVNATRYERLMQEVMSRFNPDDFTRNAPLEASYLLGYHQYFDVIYKRNESENNSENSEEE